MNWISKKTSVVVIAACVPWFAACCSTGHANPPDPTEQAEVDQRVLDLLSGYEHVPTPEDWARIGTPEEVAAALIRVAKNPQGRTLAAARATSSLAHFPRPEVATFLEARLVDTKVAPALRGKAAIALAAGFGDSKAKLIAPLFASPDEALREDAVRAFKRLASPAAERFLETRAKVEPSEHVRGAMIDAKLEIAKTRDARLKTNTYRKDLDQLAPINDPGPIR